MIWKSSLKNYLRNNFSSLKRWHSIKLNTSKYSAAEIRNIGIIAHIDAGKTTTTERMLFYSGYISHMGEVHKGDTVTDYMDQERERGITITSASVRFDWNKHQINLIDTPGHVDFTFEVERCLSVLDSAVVILDAAAGVEAQTTTVWNQAQNYGIPKLVYLNKMDKPKADVNYCVESVRELDPNAMLIQMPLHKQGNFEGIIDLISMEKIYWNLVEDNCGTMVLRKKLQSNESKLFEEAYTLRENLIGTLSDHDELLAQAILEHEDIHDVSVPLLVNALRRCTIRNHIVPITMGSSYKNLGVQLLMDNIIRLLPSPLEMNNQILLRNEKGLCAFAFKVIFHKNFGTLTFVRILNGKLECNNRIYNQSRNQSERVTKILVPFADTFEEVQSADVGAIVAISGLSYTFTGDTLLESASYSRKLHENLQQVPEEQLAVSEKLVLNGLKPPTPVFFCSVEAPSLSKQKDLDIALEKLQKEDPSFVVTKNEDTEQMIMSGMGELHLDIIKHRLRNDYKLDAYFGKLQIAYRESLDESIEMMHTDEKIIKAVQNKVTVKLRISPIDSQDFKLPYRVKVIRTEENGLQTLRKDRFNLIEQGVQAAMRQGCILGFPVINTKVELLEFTCSYATLPSFISSTVEACALNALKEGKTFLLEPIMRLDLIIPEEYYGSVLRDLSNRRSTIGENTSKQRNRILTTFTPLSEITDYSSELRRLTSGKANLFMHLHDYQRMNKYDEHDLVQKANAY